MGFKPSSASNHAAPRKVLLEKQDKWKLASQLQKSIRHGHAELAQSTAMALAGLDAAYLRYRMCVMAVEDVGAGSPDRIIEDMSQGWGAKAVAARGGAQFLSSVAASWASSTKDRLPCDFLACRHWLPEFELEHGSWQDMDAKTAIDMAYNRNLTWWERGLAAWAAAGTVRFPGGDLPEKEGEWDLLMEASQGFAGSQCAELMRIGQGQREAHPVFLPLAMDPKRPCRIMQGNIPALAPNGPWLSAALDKHTAEGKRAMRWLSSKVAASHEGLSSVPEPILTDLVGRVCFWLEGGVCNVFRADPLSVEVNNQSRARLIRSTGVDGVVLRNAMSDTSLWHAARQQALTSRDLGLEPLPGLPRVAAAPRPRPG